MLFLKKLFLYFNNGIGTLLFCWFLFSIPFFLQGKVPFPSDYLVTFFPPWNASYSSPVKNNAMPDVITQIYPWKIFTINTYKQGQIPLWNPYSFSGTPHAGNYQTAIFSPINLLFFIFSFPTAWSIHILLQPLLASLFTFYFLQENGLSKPASIVGGISFGYCGFMVTWMAYGTLGFAILLLPLLLFFIQKIIKKVTWWRLLGAVMSLTVSFLSGHFQISLYVLFASFAYTIFLLFFSQNRTIIKNIFILFFVYIFGLILAFPQFVLSFQAYTDSFRNSLVLKHEVIPWSYLITFIAPDFYGNPVTRNDWFGHYAEWASYIGVLPFVFAIFSITVRRSRNEIFWFVMALISFFLAYPTVLNDLMYLTKFPILSTSAASRIIVLSSFSLSILSAYGFDKLRLLLQKKDRRFYLFLLISVFTLIGLVFFQYIISFPEQKQIIAQRNSILPIALLIINIFFIFFSYRIKSNNKIFSYGVVLLVMFDMLRFATKWMPFSDSSNLYPNLPITNFLQKVIKNDRAFGNYGGEFSTSFSIPSIEGYDAIYQARYGEFVQAASNAQLISPERSVVRLSKSGLYSKEILQLMGVKYLVHKKADGRSPWVFPFWQNLERYTSIYNDDTYEVLIDTQVYPRVFLVDSYIVKNQKEEIINTVLLNQIDRRKVLVLEKKPLFEPDLGEGEVNILRYSPNKIVLKVTTEAPKLVFLSDVYSPGWRANSEQGNLEVMRANYVFRAVSIPKGDHMITFEYNPPYFINTLYFAIFLLILIILVSIKKLYDNRNL